jgi:hypothetical protein
LPLFCFPDTSAGDSTVRCLHKRQIIWYYGVQAMWSTGHFWTSTMTVYQTCSIM